MEQTQKNPSHGQLLFPGPHIRATLESSSLQGHLTPFTTTCLALSPHPQQKGVLPVPLLLHPWRLRSHRAQHHWSLYATSCGACPVLSHHDRECAAWLCRYAHSGNLLSRAIRCWPKHCYSTGIHCKEQEDGDWRTAECPAIAAFRNLPLMHSRSSLSPN